MEQNKTKLASALSGDDALETASTIIDCFMDDNRELKRANKALMELNSRLIGVLEAFAKKEVNVVVNSYNSGGMGAEHVGGCVNDINAFNKAK